MMKAMGSSSMEALTAWPSADQLMVYPEVRDGRPDAPSSNTLAGAGGGKPASRKPERSSGVWSAKFATQQSLDGAIVLGCDK